MTLIIAKLSIQSIDSIAFFTTVVAIPRNFMGVIEVMI